MNFYERNHKYYKISLCVANLIIGKICENEISVPYLLSSKEISETNFACIIRFVNSATTNVNKC